MPRAKAKNEEPVEAGSDVDMEEAPTSHQPENADDMSVDQDENDDAGEYEDDEAVEEEEEEEEETQRVRLVRQTPSIRDLGALFGLPETLANKPQLPGSTPTAASFEFLNEGHTLGNALRYIIMKK
ncbi:uncharacterized protein THITE_2118800 [Thermothielavioides terrestris NRRL 8126]|jgi:DNA-directed RNA polymerase I and III subunit RPAC2|uniref:Uncharacterized protein n=1 Tax=Thermothielavioides terrestris (strain ATCC 38088 / NRRL 8126) TaxID=578455 RepID=G2RAW5_THETT|nr:uncharacterized protein THITE_2118800 [Thermothielavioides terrestris NRRL 8126]AEO68940.1 hypothetical protein THITE_2118800 [Thermothielavioides terrestris NRRL 8126]